MGGHRHKGNLCPAFRWMGGGCVQRILSAPVDSQLPSAENHAKVASFGVVHADALCGTLMDIFRCKAFSNIVDYFL